MEKHYNDRKSASPLEPPVSHRNMRFMLGFLGMIIWVVLLMGISENSSAADQENCMLCHQYPMLGRVDNSGNFQSYYVSEDHYAHSVHANILCSECHQGITRIPHEKNLTVDCTRACHVIEPTTGRQFSHKSTDEMLKNSAHGAGSVFANSKQLPEDFPVCTSCHVNETLSLASFSPNNLAIDVKEQENLDILMLTIGRGRCRECHENRPGEEYVDTNLLHVVRRIKDPKAPQDIVNMCISCHNDADLNERHDLVNAVFTYRENYHGKIMILGEPSAPSCMDCHIKEGDTMHQIFSVRDERSATNPLNRGEMCARPDCHPTASLGMGKAYIHAGMDKDRFPIQFWVMFFFTILTVVSFVGLMVIMLMELFRMIFPKFTLFKRGLK